MAEENKKEQAAPVQEAPQPTEDSEVMPGQQPEAEKTEKKGKKPKARDLEAQLSAAESKAEQAEQRAGEAQEALMRTAAEYDNFRKRSQREREGAFNDGVTHAVLEMLPVIDTLEAAANAETADEEYKKGVLLTLNQCVDIFKKLGIEEIECLGGPFDPELHDAVMQEPVEGTDSGCVSRVIRKGYKLGDRVVRHSMVCVAP